MYTATNEQQQVYNEIGKSHIENGNARQQLAGNRITEKSCDLRSLTTPAYEVNVEIHDGPWQLDPS